MKRHLVSLLLTLPLLLAAPSQAGTIIKLGLSTDSLPDIELVNGELRTVVDAVGASTGGQNSEVTFLAFLSGVSAIEGANASFSLSGVSLTGTATVVGSTALQETVGGQFELYDPSNNLLLAGTLGNGTLSGPIGGTATGGFLTTEFGQFTDGSLLPKLIDAGAMKSTVSISLVNVNGGLGMSTNDDGSLADFRADATALIGAQAGALPEPGTAVLALVGALGMLAIRRR